MATHYNTLGVHRFAHDKEIKTAYGLLATQFHPDRNNNDPDKASRMAEINVAYNVLKNSDSRKEYDTRLSLGLYGKPCKTCNGKAVTWRQQGFNKKIAIPCATCGGSGVVQ